MQTALTISQIVRLPLLLIIFLSFETVALPVPVTGMPDSAASFTYSVPVRNVFLHLFNFKWSLKIPYQSHNPPLQNQNQWAMATCQLKYKYNC